MKFVSLVRFVARACILITYSYHNYLYNSKKNKKEKKENNNDNKQPVKNEKKKKSPHQTSSRHNARVLSPFQYSTPNKYS